MNLPEKEIVELIKEGNLKQSVIILMETVVSLNEEIETIKTDMTKYESILNHQEVQKAGQKSGQGTISIG
jgi:hypothetical protein